MTTTFGPTTTTDEVLSGVDLQGKRYLVTGVSAGLGVETARALLSRGAEVVGTARDLDKALRATESIAGTATGRLTLVELDLAALSSVHTCARALLEAERSFDAIIANAGVMACPRGTTADGFETQFGTNHLGHFVLVNHLLPLLKPGSRIVMLSSLAHRFGDVDLDDPNFEHTPYREFLAYGRSKTANVLFAVELDRRLRDAGIRATAVHPGGIQTELSRHVTPEVAAQLRARQAADPNSSEAQVTQRAVRKSVPQGAATSVWCAAVADADRIGGRYCEDCGVAAIDDDPLASTGVASYALDGVRAKALWALSERLVGERFG